MKKRCSIIFEMYDGGKARAEIEGTRSDVLFAIVTLIAHTCRELNIPPLSFAMALPAMLRDQKLCVEKEIHADLAAISEQIGRGGAL